MPIYVGYTQKRRTVKLLSAGNNQIFLCDAGDIELRAVINDETNIRNFTFEWTQLTGPDAQLIYVDELTSIFPFADTVDKKFRFFIDRGTPQEQFADVDIFYTPTSIQNETVFNQNSNSGFSFTVPNTEEEIGLLFDSADTSFQYNFVGKPAINLMFDKPNNQLDRAIIEKFELLGSDEFINEPTDVLLSFPGNEYPEALMLPKGSYRFKIYYSVEGLKRTTTTKLYVSNPEEKDDYYAVNTQHHMTLNEGKLTKLLRFSIERLAIPDLHSIKSLFRTNLNSLNRYTVKILKPEVEPLLETPHSIKVVFSSKLNYVTRADPSNIGNE